MSRENVEIVRRAIAAWNRRQLDDQSVIEKLFDPDVEWLPATESLFAADTYRGHEGVRRFLAELFSAWDQYALEDVEFVDAGDQVVAITRIRARTREIEIDELWSALLILRGGKIARFQGFSSPEGALEAAGLSEQRDSGRTA